MRYRKSTQISFLAGAAIAGVAVALVGCAQVSRSGLASATPSLAPSSSLYSLASSSARSTTIYESRTISFALDRIDQRELPLDQTYRHSATGKGVTVYVFDGGISDTHPELAGRVRAGFSGFPDDPKICNAHGTAVAGAIAGATLGVAPEAEIVDVKMVQCERLRGTIKAIVDGAKWVIEDHKAHPGPAIANWSFIADTSGRIAELDTAVAELRANGIPVIVSAGNLEVDACHVSPGNSPGAIVVGASRVRRALGADTLIDERAPGTAYGPCVDIFAPGDSVLLPSMDLVGHPVSQLWTGTSMSAGYVSGAIALYLEAHPYATPEAVREYLRSSAAGVRVDALRTPWAGMLYVH